LVPPPRPKQGQNILTRFILHFGEFGCALTQRIGDAPPLRVGALRRLLCENGFAWHMR
jgi:hypothetical protein